MMERATRCPNCGTREEERADYHAEGYRCLACEKIDIEKDMWAEAGPTASRGVSIRLTKEKPGPPMKLDTPKKV